jgi:hypothetical protein
MLIRRSGSIEGFEEGSKELSDGEFSDKSALSGKSQIWIDLQRPSQPKVHFYRRRHGHRNAIFGTGLEFPFLHSFKGLLVESETTSHLDVRGRTVRINDGA